MVLGAWTRFDMAMPQDFTNAVYPSDQGEVSVDFASNGTTLVELSGQVDLALAEGLDFACGLAIRRGGPVRVTVARVTFMDSTGLTLIARLAAAEVQAGRQLLIEGASRQLKDLFRVSGLSCVLQIDEESGRLAGIDRVIPSRRQLV
jgi:anti-sigma B factor antagonist